VRIALTIDPAEPGDPSLSGWVQALADDGTPVEPPQCAPNLAAVITERELTQAPRWVWAATETDYPRLLGAGVRVERCHDVALTESLLLARVGRFGEPRSLAAAWARLRGLPVPEDPRPATVQEQTALFGIEVSGAPDPLTQLEMLVAVHADQLRRIAASPDPAPGTAPVPATSFATATTPVAATSPAPATSRVPASALTAAASAYAPAPAATSTPASASAPAAGLSSLVAAESAGGLVAAEIAARGVPWRVDAHDAVLAELLGPRPFGDAPPAKLAELGLRVGAAFGHPPGRGFNPDSPNQVLRALRHAGFTVKSTRAWELREIKHPGVELLLEYKELSRLHAAHGWAWQDAWVKDGRFRPEYIVGGVVSGRWATRNSGALQIPRIMHRAVIADEGWSLVVADAGQLEPRVLAAVSGDAGLARAAAQGDLYAALAAEAFDGDRAAAKLALLGAMYGQTSGGIGPLLAVLRKRFPAAMAYVEDAARTGERGGVVYSRLGRACPPPSTRWRNVVSGLNAAFDGPESGSGSASESDSSAGSAHLPGLDPEGWGADGAGSVDPFVGGTQGRATGADADPDAGSNSDWGRRSGQAARSRGRFTRNFVIQASAADWALVWLAVLRRRLNELGGGTPIARAADGRTSPSALAAVPHLVFFVHDEVVVHTPTALAEQAARAVAEAGDEARRVVFGRTPVRFPLATAIVECYADAK
jgi:DNA polymerase-1